MDIVDANAAMLIRYVISPYSSGVSNAAIYNQNKAPIKFEIKSPEATFERFLFVVRIFFYFFTNLIHLLSS